MRTGTFSSRDAALRLNEKFACAWVNWKPEETFPNFRQLTHRDCLILPVGAGVTNVLSVFATPEGAVLNAFPGFLDPSRFREETDFALEVERRGLEAYAELHRARAEEYRPKNGPKPKQPLDESALPLGTRAHLKLAKAGVQRVGEIPRAFFQDLAPRMVECFAPRRRQAQRK